VTGGVSGVTGGTGVADTDEPDAMKSLRRFMKTNLGPALGMSCAITSSDNNGRASKSTSFSENIKEKHYFS
jgi:hypothetical protein